MPGIRIKHPTLTGTTYVVPVLDRPLTAPLYCHVCDREHVCKTYHFDLDGEGAVIVSEEVYAELQKVGMATMTMENEVTNPPPVGIGMGHRGNARKRGEGKPIHITRGRRKKG